MERIGKIFIVGIGPGAQEHMTGRALEALRCADYVIGYTTYIGLLRGIVDASKLIASPMKKEVERCGDALDFACKGHSVALVSSGDAGIYGMAGIMIEVAGKESCNVAIEVIPGISAAQAAAALLGAPIMHDHATISLSDLVTDWDAIRKRIALAAEGDFVLCIYNPKSKTRTEQIKETREIVLKYREKDTPVGIVKSAMREGQKVTITDIEHMLEHDIDMTTLLLIGNSKTFVRDNRMITPRGYTL